MSNQNLTHGFHVAGPEAIDDRFVFQTEAHLSNSPVTAGAIDIDTIYAGLLTYVIDINAFCYFTTNNNRTYLKLPLGTRLSVNSPTNEIADLGTFWLNTTTHVLYVYNNTNSWVIAVPSQGNSPRIIDTGSTFSINGLPDTDEYYRPFYYNHGCVTTERQFILNWRIPTGEDIQQLMLNIKATQITTTKYSPTDLKSLSSKWTGISTLSKNKFGLSFDPDGIYVGGLPLYYGDYSYIYFKNYPGFTPGVCALYLNKENDEANISLNIGNSGNSNAFPIRLMTTVDPEADFIIKDGVKYGIIKIDGPIPQWWLNKSLSAHTFCADGVNPETPIYKVSTALEWTIQTESVIPKYSLYQFKANPKKLKSVIETEDDKLELLSSVPDRIVDLEHSAFISAKRKAKTYDLVKFNTDTSKDLESSRITDTENDLLIKGLPTRSVNKRGYLYNLAVVLNSVTIAPTGWRVANRTDWTTLTATIRSLYTYDAKALSSQFGWSGSNIINSPGLDPLLNNASLFGGVPGGSRDASGTFANINIQSRWYAQSSGITHGEHLFISNSLANSSFQSDFTNKIGASIRCVKEDNSAPSTEQIYDVNGNAYNWVKIGDQYWLTSNLRATKFQDGTSITNLTQASQWAATTSPAYCSYNNESISPKFLVLTDEEVVETMYLDDQSESATSNIYEPAPLDSVQVPISVGGISAGTTAGSLRGKTISQIIDMLLFPAIDPTVTDGRLTSAITGGNIIEVTTVPIDIFITVTGNRGSINRPWDGNSVQAPYLGLPGTLTSTPTPITSSGSGLVYTQKYTQVIPVGITSFNHSMNFAAGPVPLNSAGLPSTNILPATATTKTNITNMEGVYPIYHTKNQADPAFKTKAPLLSASAKSVELWLCTADINGQPSIWIPVGFFTPTTPVPTFYQPDPTILNEWVVNPGSDYSESVENIGTKSYKKYSYVGTTRGATKVKVVF